MFEPVSINFPVSLNEKNFLARRKLGQLLVTCGRHNALETKLARRCGDVRRISAFDCGKRRK